MQIADHDICNQRLTGLRPATSDDLSSPEPQAGLRRGSGPREGTMRGTYQGLPPAKSVEQAIVLAQRLIARDLERRKTALPERWDQNDREEKKCA